MQDNIENGGHNLRRLGASLAIIVPSALGFVAMEATPAAAWSVKPGVEASCEQNGGNGEAIAHLQFGNSEPVGSHHNVMIVSPEITDHEGHAIIGADQVVAPGQTVEWTIDMGSAPSHDKDAVFRERWQDHSGSDSKELHVPDVETCAPEPTTTTTMETTTTTTVPETTTTTMETTTTTTVPEETTTTTVEGTTTTTTIKTPNSTTTTVKTPVKITGELPRTGNDSEGKVFAALAAISAGAGLGLLAAKRRRLSAEA